MISPSVVALVLANLIPVVAVLLFGWDVATILVLYWIENGIVGILNVPKILLARGPVQVTDAAVARIQDTMRSLDAPPWIGLAYAPFFVLHYGIFWLAHGAFVFSLPFVWGGSSTLGGDLLLGGVARLSDLPVGIVVAAAGLALSHVASLWFNFIEHREYLDVSPMEQMFRPYGRLVVLHVTILFGGTAVAALGQPVALLVVLVAAKTIFDLREHLREHRLSAGRAATRSPSDWLEA